MFASIYTTLTGGLMQERRLEVISNNLANANTNGFKKDMPVFESYLIAEGKSDNATVGNGLTENAKNSADFQAYANKGTLNVMAGASKERAPNENVFVNMSEIKTNFEQGSLKPTGNELDLAIQGKGMFGFQTDSGVMYGRNGTFHLNSNGEMVNAEGYRLLDKNDNSIVVNPQQHEKIIFGEDGEILASTNGRSVSLGFIKLAEFENPEKLQKIGSSLYRNQGDVAGEKNLSVNNSETKVVQGFVELSNVNVVREMTEMIQANRGYQTMQKVIQSVDGINQKLIQIVGRPI